MKDTARAALVTALHDAANAIAEGAEVTNYNIGGNVASGDTQITVGVRVDPNLASQTEGEPAQPKG